MPQRQLDDHKIAAPHGNHGQGQQKVAQGEGWGHIAYFSRAGYCMIVFDQSGSFFLVLAVGKESPGFLILCHRRRPLSILSSLTRHIGNPLNNFL